MKIAVAARACRLAPLIILSFSARASAIDVSDELTAGALSSNLQRSTSPYLSDRLGTGADATKALSLSADGTYTRYFRANHVPGENIFQFLGAADYEISDHLSFGLDLRGSPPSTAVTPTATGSVKSRTSLVGAGASAEYDTAGDGDFETIAESYVGLTSYSTTQKARSSTKGSPSSLLQWRASLGVTEIFFRETEGRVFASYYAYSTDPGGTGYFGASVFGREAVGEGLPLEPLRWSLRPSVEQRLGPVKLIGFFQYGHYVDELGWNVAVGLKAQVKVNDAWRVWASINFQRDVESTGENLSIPWGALGARVFF